MQTRLIAASVAFAACSFTLFGCSDDSPAPSPSPSPSNSTTMMHSTSSQQTTSASMATSTTTTRTTTTAALTCQPGNELDECTQRCGYCDSASRCTVLGSVGCDGSQCVWVPDNTSTQGGLCQSPHATTTTSTTPSTGCEPHTNTDPCFTRGTYAQSESACVALGPIGCQHQVCHYYATPDGPEACGSRHATTTVGPCVPGTETDKCFTLCASYCSNSSQCIQLGGEGCGDVACAWVNGHCQSSSSFLEMV